MTALSVARALLWQEARERALVLVIMLLLPFAAALCTAPFYSLDIALYAAVAAALLCALRRSREGPAPDEIKVEGMLRSSRDKQEWIVSVANSEPDLPSELKQQTGAFVI